MEERKGNLLILIAALLFSLGGLCIKMIQWDGMAINGGRSLISCMILFAYMRITKKPLKVTKGTLFGACCVIGTNVLYSYANTMTTAANAILLQFVAPVFIILFMWIFFHELPKRLDVITCILVFSGIGCFVLDGLSTGHLLGDIMGLGSGLAYAGVFMMNKLPGGDSFSSTFLGHLTSGLLGAPFILLEEHITSTSILFMVFMGVFQMGIAYVCFCAGLKRVKPVSGVLISGVEPVMNPLLVAIFVGEVISPIAAVGGALVLVTVMVYNILLVKRSVAVPTEDPQMMST